MADTLGSPTRLPRGPEWQRIARTGNTLPLRRAAANGEREHDGGARPPERAQAQDHSLERAVATLNEWIRHVNKQLRFVIHEERERVMVRVVEAETQEVIREIPPERVLDTIARIKESIGLLLDEWA